MDERTGNAILITIVATSVYRIVVLRRLLLTLRARERADAAALRVSPVRPGGAFPRVPRQGFVVRGGDGVALDPTIVLPGTA